MDAAVAQRAGALLDWMWDEQMSLLLVYHRAVWNFGSHTIEQKVWGWLTLEKPQELRSCSSLSPTLKVKLPVSEVSFRVE